MNDELKERTEALNSLDSLPKEMQSYLKNMVKELDKEEFISAVMVGPCPNCKSDKTMDCENTPFEDICIGLCLECYILWCLECGEIFKKDQKVCGHCGMSE
ncbi:MAG: hypothetical protein ACUZ8E_11800 [Candidatus Anammoxibacter sp.]